MFTHEDFKIDMNEISVEEEIGKGNFSTVFVGKWKGQRVSIKRQKRKEKDIQNYLWRELTLLKSFTHRNLLRYIGASNDEKTRQVWIITEYLPNGDVQALLQRPEELGWQLKMQIALDAARGMCFLHEKGFLHRDIKTANMLLDENWHCKLCDFGFARHVTPDLPRRMTLCGTDAYMAPEIYFDEEYDARADVFSFGIALIEIITRKQVNVDGFMLRKPSNNFQLDFEQFRAAVPTDCPNSLIVLAECCCTFEPHERLTSIEVLEWLEDLFKEIPEEKCPNSSLSSSNGSGTNQSGST